MHPPRIYLQYIIVHGLNTCWCGVTVTAATIPPGAVVFFRTDWSRGWPAVNTDVYPGVSLAALQFLHLQRQILMHGHEPLDTDSTATLEGEAWLMHHHYAQAEGVRRPHLHQSCGHAPTAAALSA